MPLTIRNKPPSRRIKSRQENEYAPTVKIGVVMWMNQVIPASMMTRKMSASDRPMRRAVSCCSRGRRATMTEMKTTLSMPSTISIALKAMKLAQTCGSVRSSSMREA